ncbi:MAG: DUF4293 domain-containing protein [Saprospiraceae bacterium]|nr:DUF4293 domain-containing protein [Saprospiraceae bacterium]
MLQRAQSIYLALIVISCLVLFFIPIVQYNTMDLGLLTINLYGGDIAQINTPNTIYLAILNTIIMVFTAVIIFMFKNRKRQVSLLMIDMLLALGFLAMLYWLVFAKIEAMDEVMKSPNYKIGAFLPLLNILLIIISSRKIRKDEAMVKSADRLR